MVNILNYIDNFIFVISLNRKIKFANKAILNKIKMNLKDIVDTPVKNCLYSNARSIDNLIDSLDKNENINFDFYLEIDNIRYNFNGDLIENDFYGEKSYFIIARDICEKYYKRQDLEILLDNIDLGCFIKNKNGEYLYANKKKCDFHNKTKEQIIGNKTCDLFDREEAEYIEKVENEVAKRKYASYEENRFMVNSERKWYEIAINSVLNEDGSIKNLIGSSKNVEIRKHIENTLNDINIKFIEINKFLDQNSNAYKKNIMDLLDYISDKIMANFQADGMAIVFYKTYKEEEFSVFMGKGVILDDLNFTQEERKKTYENTYFKYSEKSELEGVKYVDDIKNDIIVKKLKDKNIYKIGIYNISIRDRLLGHIVITFLRDTKSIEYGYDYIKTICSHLAVTISNINESIKIQKELDEYKERKEYLQKCIDMSVDIVGKLDKEGKLIYINEDRLKNILGWNAKEFEELKEIKEQFKYKNINYKDAGALYSISRYESESTINHESKILCKNGQYKWLEWNLKQYKDEDSLFFTVKDITEKKEYQRQQQLLQETVELETLKNKFFNNLSHEFRTPINIILGIVQLIEQRRNNNNYKLENIDYHIDILKRNSYRLLRLVQNLLDLSQIQSQYYNVNFGNYDIVEIVEDIVMSVAEYLKDKSINLIFDTNCEEQIISCDPEKIDRIILNLLSNAIKYNKDNNDIEVYMDISEEYVKISVKDHGIGIEKKELETIFDEFKKVNDGLARPCEGSGIGLSIVNEFAHIHKGKINVFSEIGKGTTFEVVLPNKINDLCEKTRIENDNIVQNKIERCDIEFSDIYN